MEEYLTDVLTLRLRASEADRVRQLACAEQRKLGTWLRLRLLDLLAEMEVRNEPS